ncbi:nascent polypeptide-associated complex subunit alpha [Pancytospora philotis]|nr:nascent polypeptide-associated complex subunit alpha [Pancytospora philotis]
MATELSSREQAVLSRFAKYGTSDIETDTVTFTSSGTMFNVKNSRVVRIGNTDNLLVFGDIQKSIGLEDLKRWLEENAANLGKPQDGAASDEIDGDAHECGDDCDGHHAAAAESHEDAADSDPQIKEADVKLIMEQVSASRQDVVAALKAADYDVVSALVELSKKE